MSNKITSALGWKLLERFGVQGVQFVLQIILARLLSPEHYGVLSIMIIFTTLANVFIQTGFNTALIQNKDVDDDDYSSVFWVSILIAVVLYAVLFFTAPFIAEFYNMPSITTPFRVLALMLFPGAINSIQLAKISRELNFKKVFVSNLGAIIVSGVAGIIVAYLGGGIWALVVQTLLNILTACVVMLFTVKWRPRFVCNLSRIRILLSFGWKILVSCLIDTLYQDLSSLVIGKKYDGGTLGHFNRGKQFPQFIITSATSAVQSVMLPAMAAEQDNPNKVKLIMRRSLSMSAYISFPIMAGLAAVSPALISLLLTDKWLPCVPYVQIFCFSLAFNPIHTCNLQALNAMGRGDVFLRLELVKKSYGLILLIAAVVLFDTPIALAMTGVVTTVISCFVNAYPSRQLLGYSYLEFIMDILPSFLLSVAMAVAVMFVDRLALGNLETLLVQIALGVVIYILGSAIFRIDSFSYICRKIKEKFSERG